MGEQSNPWLKVLYARALAAGDAALVQVQFHASVLDRYRQRGLEIKRTDTAGRLRKPGGWSLDFGIGKGDETIHAGFGTLVQALPEGEIEHWADHVAQRDLSENFCRMRLHPGSCFDDGELRDW